jgi:hypothetical protein
MHLIKLSTYLFQGGMKDSGSETCGIERLDGTSFRTRSTLFLENTWKTQVFIKRITQINVEKIQDQSNQHQRGKKSFIDNWG